MFVIERIKIEGVRNLHAAISGKDVDFVYLMSSISSLSAAWSKGMVDYAIANAFMNGFAANHSSDKTKWISCNWCMWKNIGMGKMAGLLTNESIPSLNVNEALDLFDHSLNAVHSNIIAANVQIKEEFSFYYSKKIEKKIDEPLIGVKEVINSFPILSVSNTSVYDFIKELVAEATELPLEKINDNDSFTNLGLDSLNAIDIIKKIEEKFGLQLHPTLLFEHDSISALSAFLSIGKFMPPASQTIDTEIELTSLPLLPAQKTFYANQVFYPESPCNSLVRLDYEKQFDLNLLKNCWITVVQNNESLRCSFKMKDEGPVQYINKIAGQNIDHYQINDKSNHGEQLKSLEDKIIKKVYWLDQPPLFNLCLIDYPSPRSSIIFCVHHIISDAWSMSLILKELMYMYEQEKNGKPETSIKDRAYSYNMFSIISMRLIMTT